jgi:hypothetical protein
MLLDLIVGLAFIWIGSITLLGVSFMRERNKDCYQWCACGKYNLRDKVYLRTKTVAHYKQLCQPVREMIFLNDGK